MAKQKINKGQRIAEDCLEKAKLNLNLFSDEEIREYTIRVLNKAREYEDLGGQASLQKAMQEINKKEMDILLSNATIKANNTFKFEKAASKIKDGINLRSLLVPTTVNKDYNIEKAQQVARQELYREVFGRFTKEQEQKLLSGKFNDDILASMDGVKIEDPDLKTIGDLIKKYIADVRNPEIVKSNALPPEFINPDRMLRNFHNPSLIAGAGQSLVTRALSRNKVNVDSAKNIWREYMKQRLDLMKTFGETDAMNADGTLNMKKVDSIIDTSFDNIIQQRSAIFTRSVVANDREAMARRRRMFYHFKDWRSWGEYNSKFGKGSLFEALLGDVQGSGNQIGMARLFGDSPYSMYNDLRKVQVKERNLEPWQYRVTDKIFNQVKGVDNTAYSPTLANIGGGLRAWSSMARLGSLVINSLSDISQVAGVAQRFGYGFWQPYFDSLANAFNLMPSADRAVLARVMKMNLDVHMGYMGRFIDANNMGQILNKASNTFYWSTFATGWDKGNKLSATTIIARGLGRDSTKDFAALNSQTRSQLEKFNITASEWDSLRSKTQDRLFTSDNVDALSQAEIKELWEKSDKIVPLSEYRSHLYRKVYGLFDTVVENAVLDPRAFERMVTTYNLPPGTIGGEAVRMFMQFKSFPIANFRRVWYGGLKDMDSTQGKFMYALNMAAGNFMLGYASIILGSWAKGLTAPDPAVMSTNEKWKFYTGLLAPGLGTFLRVMDADSQNPQMAVNLLLSPSVRLFTDPMAAGLAVATGNEKGAVRVMKDFARYANPIGTIPFAEPFFDSLMGKAPYLQPGQRPL